MLIDVISLLNKKNLVSGVFREEEKRRWPYTNGLTAAIIVKRKRCSRPIGKNFIKMLVSIKRFPQKKIFNFTKYSGSLPRNLFLVSSKELPGFEGCNKDDVLNPCHSISPIWESHFRVEFLFYLKALQTIN